MKTIFSINVDHCVDIITNSSSELFVLEGATKDIVEEMIKEVYPNYLDEYEPVVALRDASPDQIDTYFDYKNYSWSSNYHLSKEQRRQNEIDSARNLAEEYNMTPEEFYRDWKKSIDSEWVWLKKTDEALKKIAEKIDPQGKMYMLFSIDENPNWDYQEKLMYVAERYHLG